MSNAEKGLKPQPRAFETTLKGKREEAGKGGGKCRLSWVGQMNYIKGAKCVSPGCVTDQKNLVFSLHKTTLGESRVQNKHSIIWNCTCFFDI